MGEEEMIRIIVEVTDKSVGYRFEDDDPTLSEVGLANLKLDEAKDWLRGFEFDSDFELTEGYGDEEEGGEG